jgi:hypothetical protein
MFLQRLTRVAGLDKRQLIAERSVLCYASLGYSGPASALMVVAIAEICRNKPLH